MKSFFSSAISLMLLFVLLSILSCAGIPQKSDAPIPSQQIQRQAVQPSVLVTSTSPYYTGDGGKGMGITIIKSTVSGLAENQNILPRMVEVGLNENIRRFSAIELLDWKAREEVNNELESGNYGNNPVASQNFGNAIPTTHFAVTTLARMTTGYALQIQIVKTSDKTTAGSYSGTCTLTELENSTAVQRASMKLLQDMGVMLTEQAQRELSGRMAENVIRARTVLAQGITAQRQGNDITALFSSTYAALLDPSLQEAVSRSSILTANISSGNIGEDIRLKIRWREEWVARLTEMEQLLDRFNKTESMPYTLFYTTDNIRQIGQINYQNSTAVMGGIETHLHGSGIWTLAIERTLQTVYDSLEATKMKDEWGLGGWPRQGVTNLNFAGRRQNFTVVFELLNNQNKVIGRQTLQTGGSWGLNWNGRPVVNVNADDRKSLNFENVNANDIDGMTIRVATVNGTNAEIAARNGVLQILASTKSEFEANDRFRFSRGELQGFAGDKVANLVIPSTIWGDPVISIANGAFRNTGLIIVTIPNSVTSIGSEAFLDNKLRSLTIGANVAISSNAFGDGFQFFSENYNQNGRKADTYIQSQFLFVRGEIRGFVNNDKWTKNLVIPDAIWGNPVTSIRSGAFSANGITITGPNSYTHDTRIEITTITIGANVNIARNGIVHVNSARFFSDGSYSYDYIYFADNYNRQGRKAGVYKWGFFGWVLKP